MEHTNTLATGLDSLDRLSSGEDEFDVDLMACGCRLATGGKLDLSIYDLLRLYQFDQHALAAFIGSLVDHGKIDHSKVFELADHAIRSQTKEEDTRPSLKAK